MSELRDFLNWFDGFAENIEKQPSTKQWAKIKERVAALHAMKVEAAAVTPMTPPAPGKVQEVNTDPTPAPRPKPHMSKFKFVIDQHGAVRRGSGQPVMPDEVSETLFDMRGGDADLGSIIWADGSTGLPAISLDIADGTLQ